VLELVLRLVGGGVYSPAGAASSPSAPQEDMEVGLEGRRYCPARGAAASYLRMKAEAAAAAAAVLSSSLDSSHVVVAFPWEPLPAVAAAAFRAESQFSLEVAAAA